MLHLLGLALFKRKTVYFKYDARIDLLRNRVGVDSNLLVCFSVIISALAFVIMFFS